MIQQASANNNGGNRNIDIEEATVEDVSDMADREINSFLDLMMNDNNDEGKEGQGLDDESTAALKQQAAAKGTTKGGKTHDKGATEQLLEHTLRQ